MLCIITQLNNAMMFKLFGRANSLTAQELPIHYLDRLEDAHHSLELKE